MNIEIANRLVNLRKSNNLSQEALAEKLGISRQAVSKWERAEASPDTDNLIMLARLYRVSLDELLKTEEQPKDTETETIPPENTGVDITSDDDRKNEEGNEENPGSEDADNRGEEETADSEYVHIGLGGVHVKDKDGSEVHIGWNGVHVDDSKRGENVHIDKDGVYVNGEKYNGMWNWTHYFSLATFVTILYLLIGIFFNAWHPGWLLFILIPIWHSFVEAIKKRNANLFAYPVLTVFLFLCGGFFLGTWHPGWVIFVTIPLYYGVVASIRGERHNNWE